MANYRKPSQYEDLAYDDQLAEAEKAVPTDGVSNQDAIDVAADIQEKQSAQSEAPNRQAQAVGRLVAGATPTLFGFLFGPQQSEKGIAQTQRFYAGGKPSKLVPVADESGNPIYETSENAIGEKIYQKPLATKAPSAAGLVNVNLVHRQSGKPTVAILNKATNQMIEAGTGQPISMQDYAPAIDTRDQVKIKDMYGNELLKVIPKYGELTQGQNVPLSKGYGAQYGLPTEDVKRGDQYATKYIADSNKIHESKATLKGAIDLLNSPDTDPIAQAAGIFRAAKIIVNERISDKELGVVTLPPGLLEKLSNQLDMAMNNKNPQESLRQLRKVLVDLDNVNDLALASMQDRAIQAYSGGDMKKAKYLSDKIVSAPKVSVSNPSAPAQPIAQKVAPKAIAPKKPVLTEQQWNALPESKKRELMMKGKK